MHEVFEYIRNPDNVAHWQTTMVYEEHEREGQGTRVTEVRHVLGRRVEIQGELTVVEPDRRVAFSGSGRAVKHLEYQHRLFPEASGTRLDTKIELEPGQAFGLATPIMQRVTDRELVYAHETLKDLLENQTVGEPAPARPRIPKPRSRRPGAGQGPPARTG